MEFSEELEDKNVVIEEIKNEKMSDEEMKKEMEKMKEEIDGF